MEAAAILATLRARGAVVRLVGERLAVEPRSALDDALRAAIQENRDGIRTALRGGGEGDLHPPAQAINTSTVPPGAAEDLPSEPIIAVRTGVSAVLVRSPNYGEIWLVIEPDALEEIAEEESTRQDPRPVLLVDEAQKLRGKSAAAIRAVLEVARAFPGARIVQ